MCGISGFFCDNLCVEESKNIIEKMNNILLHRGPDNKDIYIP